MITSFIKKYILPKETDFIASMQEHSKIIESIVIDLYGCFINHEDDCCKNLLESQTKAQDIREKNMAELLNTFITPIDRESIYRVIFQLNWIAESIRHFLLEAKAYETNNSNATYEELIGYIKEQSRVLNLGFLNLGTDIPMVASCAQGVRDGYEKIVEKYIFKMAELSKSDDTKEMFIQRELLSQIKEIGKRFQTCANSLEDIVVKMS
jgi:hypothetical protein